MTHRHRLALIAGLVVFLMSIGAGSAYAIWTSTTTGAVTAAAASTSISQSNSVAGLDFTYDEASSAYVAAGAVTIQNTGSRPASYQLALTPHDASNPTLPNQISVAVGSVSSAAACSAAATLTNQQTGTLATVFAYDSASIPQKLAAQQTVVLCVKTTFNAALIGNYGATNLKIDLVGRLVYAPGAAWTVAATAATVTQQVVTQDIRDLLNGAGRFYVFSAYDADPFEPNGNPTPNITTVGGYCLANGADPLRFGMTTNVGCGGWNDQVRLVAAPNSANEFMMLQNLNGWDQPATPRWQYTNQTTDVTLGTPVANATNQRWVIEGRGDGTYRIVEAVSSPTANRLCLQYTDLDINPNSVGGSTAVQGFKQIRPAPCVTNAAGTHDTLGYRRQGFRFDLIGTPLPPASTYPDGYVPTCSVNSSNNFAEVVWPVSTGYEQETRFRMLWTYQGLDASNQPFTVPAQVVATHENGSWTHIQMSNTAAGVESYWTYLQNYLTTHGLPASGTSVTIKMTVEQQITNADVYRRITSPITMGFIHQGTNDNLLYCGVPSAPPTPPSSGLLPITCTGSQWSLNFEWANATNGQVNGSKWAIYLDGMNVSNPPGGSITTNFWGSATVLTNFASSASAITTWWNAQGKPNLTDVVLTAYYKSGSTWAPYASGRIDVVNNGGQANIYCS